MTIELVSIPTAHQPLDGLLYRPDGPVRGGVLLFHGNTTNFYSGPSRFLPPYLVDAGFVCLAFNRRGHDVVITRPGKLPGGGAFQTAAEGIDDDEQAARYLASEGFDRPIVIGHSNGGLLGSQFAADHPETAALVLLSAHAGGPDTYLRAGAAGELGAGQSQHHLDLARSLVADGRGDELMLVPGWWYAISAASLVDRHENTPDLLDNARSITCPALFLVGDREAAEVYPAEAFASRSPGRAEARIVADCDHWYTGVEDTVARMVVDWLTDVVG